MLRSKIIRNRAITYWQSSTTPDRINSVNRYYTVAASVSLLALYACATSPVFRIAEVSRDAGPQPQIQSNPSYKDDASTVAVDAARDAALGVDAAPDASKPIEAGVPSTCSAPPTQLTGTPLAGLPASFTDLRVSPNGLVAVGYDSSSLPVVYERASIAVPFGDPVSFLPTNYDWEKGFAISPDGLQVTVVELGDKRLASFRRAALGLSFVDASGVPKDARSNNPVHLAATDTLSSPVLIAAGTSALIRVNLANGAARGAYLVSIDSNAAGTGSNDLVKYAVDPFTPQPSAQLTGFDQDQSALYFSAGTQSYVMYRADIEPFSAPKAIGTFGHATPGNNCAVVYGVGALGPSVYSAP